MVGAAAGAGIVVVDGTVTGAAGCGGGAVTCGGPAVGGGGEEFDGVGAGACAGGALGDWVGEFAARVVACALLPSEIACV